MAFNVSGGSDEENSDLAEINIIPLVDVMLVLLIIFMVTAPLSIGGIKVNLPSSRAGGTSVEKDRVVLSITKDGDYYLEKLEVPHQNLRDKFKAIYEYREEKRLYIRADKGVPYGSVVYAMNAAKSAGVARLAMLTHADATAQGTGG